MEYPRALSWQRLSDNIGNQSHSHKRDEREKTKWVVLAYNPG
jgi:hypothetical protein